MKKEIFLFVALLVGVWGSILIGADQEKKLNIIAFGAHPDDCDLRAGGTAAKWAVWAAGFVSWQ